MSVTNISKASDKDAEYVQRRIVLMEECAKAIDTARNDIERRTSTYKKARLEAGQRLIEVRERMAGQNPSSHATANVPGWHAWLNSIGMPRETARDLMREAGLTEEERTKRREKDAKRKRAERSKADDDDDDDEEEPQTPKQYLEAFQMRTSYIREVTRAIERYAQFGKPVKTMITELRAAAQMIDTLAQKLEKQL